MTFFKWRMFLPQGSSKVFCKSTGIFHEIVCAFKWPSFENYSIIIWKPEIIFQEKLWDCQCNWVDISEELSLLFLFSQLELTEDWEDWEVLIYTSMDMRYCSSPWTQGMLLYFMWVPIRELSEMSLVLWQFSHRKGIILITHCKTIRYDFIVLLIFAQKIICAGLALVQGSFILWNVLRR